MLYFTKGVIPMLKKDFEVIREYVLALFDAQMKQMYDALQKSIPEVPEFKEYDDTELKAKIDEVAKSIPEVPEFKEYDDTELKAKIDEVAKSIPEVPEFKEYDDTELKAKIDEVAKSIPEVPEFKEYDDSELRAKIDEVAKSIPEVPEFKEYDDSELRAKIDEVAKSIPEVPEFKEYDDAWIKEALAKPLELDLPPASHYDGTAVSKGAMVLHDNNLYVNLIDDNASEPSEKNASYKLLIKSPKAPTHKGVYDVSKTYEENDIVMWENSSWIKTSSPEQSLPSDGWKLLAKAVRGRKGEKGDTTVVEVDNTEMLQRLVDEIEILKATNKGLQDDIATA